MVDKQDDVVYKYAPDGTPEGNFALTSANAHPEGITTDGETIFVADINDNVVYKYDLLGNGTGTFALVGDNQNSAGITTDGTSLWVLDKNDNKVYRYTLAGVPAGDFDLADANKAGTGIATDGSTIYVVDQADKEVYKYNTVGDHIGSFHLNSDNNNPEGITSGGSAIWVVNNGDEVFQYNNGVFIGIAFDLIPDNSRPTGIASLVGVRVVDGLIVLYEFEETSGPVVHDTSGFGTPLDLEIRDLGNTNWGDGALSFNSRTIAKSDGAAIKVIDAMQATNEITIEGWLKPANTSQDGPARIVTLSRNPSYRNFTLGQEDGFYDTRLRTTSTSLNGSPSLSTPGGTLTTDLTHVVYTREHPSGRTRTYIDGVLVAEGSAVSTFNNWDDEMMLGLANEITRNRTWLGEMHLVALYNRALDPDEVEQNFNAGP